MVAQYESIDEAWVATIEKLKAAPSRPSRNGPAKEILGYGFELTDSRHNFLFNRQRMMSVTYAAAEFLWYMSGSESGDMITHYAPQYKRFLDDGIAMGAYGPRIVAESNTDMPWHPRCPIKLIRDMLREDKDSRQAVIGLFRPADLISARHKLYKDLPCTLTLQFLVRDGALHMVTNMRSNDAWLGLPYDVFCMTSLQALLSQELNMLRGSYFHFVGSMHLYEKDEAKCQNLTMADDHFFVQRTTDPFDEVQVAVDIERGFRAGVIRTELIDRLSGLSNGLPRLCAALCLGKNHHYADLEDYVPRQFWEFTPA